MSLRRPSAVRAVCGWLLLIVSLWPTPASSWGTLTSVIMTEAEKDKLKGLIADYAIRPSELLAQFTERRGPHPIHQFIVYQAYLLLQDDPAFKDGDSGFPSGEAINAWDGVDRSEHGMKARDSAGATTIAELAPTIPGVGGPGADAELTQKLGWNPLYNGRAHYWNPWLRDGEAPKAAGANYSRLVRAIVEGADVNTRAHYAAYMAHYLADVASAKHADAFTLDGRTLTRLIPLAERWVGEASDDIIGWLASSTLASAVRLIRARAYEIRGDAADAYWARIDAHIANVGSDTLLKRENFWKVHIAPSSLESAVACYLHDLAGRAQGRRLDQFYTYFDPLYFNGPIYDPVNDAPQFKLCTPLGEHLFWETNPSHFHKAIAWMSPPARAMTTGGARANYRKFERAAAFFASDWTAAVPAMEAAAGALTEACSAEAHGPITDSRDFEVDPQAHLETAIRHVFTAFRASITALRVEAVGRTFGDSGVVNLQVTVRNLADRPAKMTSLRVAYRDAATKALTSAPGWTRALGGRQVTGEPLRIKVKLSGLPDGVGVSDLIVDVRGEVSDTPDAGWRRVQVEERELSLVRNPSASTTLTDAKGPIDLIVVMDTTGSMKRSIDSLRKNAIASIKRLQGQTDDIRLAVTTFRDLGEAKDKPFFKVSGFTEDLESQFAFLNSLTADGGGDTPEDQLHGISLGLKLWEDELESERVPTKIIVVVTDAPAKSPDSRGNTFKSIAKRAFEVDPAHIYPIAVGRNAAAQKHAEELATLTGGEVLRAGSGDEVADKLLAAVDSAVATYPAPPTAASRLRVSSLLVLILGGVLVLLGLIFVGRAAVARRSVASEGGSG